ncbi:TonB-dependent receptor [Mesonia aquimarina]|uniref:TonB-dependent receptor n=1 Tax=Mesonia aquimarina TaxID=1504967 RepID=UPI000EF5ACF7|nr:TonB-dependent receptor [Mesonia aquimarina]
MLKTILINNCKSIQPKKNFFFFGLFYILFVVSLQAQEVQRSGIIQDSLQNPIAHANVIATPQDSTLQTTFSITDQQGRYKLDLIAKKSYALKITHLAFGKQLDSVNIAKSDTKNYTLFKRTESLEEVVIEQEMAVVVKEDTIRYKVDQFKTGDERKLRDILKKLPGVEVDREGNVKVNGKKVKKLMIEGQEFFTGDPKLGVNNIPADAVKEVEALDNDPEIAMLKGLDDSQRMVLNIKLKEGKKNFAFGESEVGGGIKERYYVNPNIFYYSPKRSINVLGDFNNTGESAFSYSDLMDFEGGFYALRGTQNKFATQPSASLFSGNNGFLNKNKLGAASWSERLAKYLRLDAYAIVKDAFSESRTVQEINYFSQEQEDEYRVNQDKSSQFFSLGKVKLRYDNLNDWDVQTNFLIKYADAEIRDQTISRSANENIFFNDYNDTRSFSITNVNSINKKFSYKHTLSINTNFEYNEKDNNFDWLFNQPIFNEIIPIVETPNEDINLLKNNSSSSQLFQLDAKHYWVLNNTNHLYPSAGINYLNKDFNTFEYQALDDGSINNFQDAGFNNQLDFKLIDVFGGFQYKAMFGKWITRAGAFAHLYSWRAKQFDSEIVNNQKAVILPEAMAKWDINDVEKFRFDYRLNSTFADAEKFANRFQLMSFNSIYSGNENLENELYHDLDVSYRNYSYYSKINYSIRLGYAAREQSIREVTQLEGINYINTSILTDLPENTYSGNVSVSKRFKSGLTLSVNGNTYLRDYARIVNTERIDYNSNNYSYSVKGKYYKKNFPTIEIAFRQSFSVFSSKDQEATRFTQLNPRATIKYRFFKDFLFEGDYEYTYYLNQNTNQSSTFQIGNASLRYKQESSAWGFGVEAMNVFDVNFRRNNTASNFLISDRRTFLQPRILLLKVTYQL